MRERCSLDVVGHRDAHSNRIVQWKKGDRKSAFPPGTLLEYTFLGVPLDPPSPGAVLGTPHPTREEVELELAEKATELAHRDEEGRERRERQRVRDERRARAEAIADDEEHELEALAQRVRIDVEDPIWKPIDVSGVIAALAPKSIVRRDVDDGRRALVLRTRPQEDERRKEKRKRRRRRRGANDPPE